MSTQNLIAGLQLTQLYRDKEDTTETGANHDVIYIFATDKPLSKEHIQSMLDLGFHQEYEGLDYNEDFKVDDYRADESWHFYT